VGSYLYGGVDAGGQACIALCVQLFTVLEQPRELCVSPWHGAAVAYK
jgi:hypothetical protein